MLTIVATRSHIKCFPGGRYHGVDRPVMDRIELNGHIERLIDSNGHDGEARQAVLDFALGIRGSSSLQVRGLIQKPGSTITGQTPEHGEVKVEDERAETKEFTAGAILERVGFYKIWRQKDWIHISHFWKAEAETASETEAAQQWVLALGKDNQAVWFGERGFKHLFSLKLTSLLRIDFGREMFEERWGPEVARQHKGALVVGVSINA